ncbi:MAG: DUF975 family protein [Clostridia bacterium]
MWKIKELKRKARKVLKKNYWTALVVCFIIALLTGEFGTSIIGLWQSEDSVDPTYIMRNEQVIERSNLEKQNIISSNTNSLLDYSEKIDEKMQVLTDMQQKIVEMIRANLNSATKTQKYIFKIWDAIELFNFEQPEIATGLTLTAIIAFVFTVIIADPLIVAGKRYFLKIRNEKTARMGEMKEIFKKGSWINVAITMLLRNIYNFLWYFTIIGGVIKMYEYRMIPYILAENPKTNRKEAFKLSKQMMKGNKWKTFLLDVSFIVWNILSVFTLGLLNILYVNPYKATTNAELYVELRNIAKKEKYEYVQNLNDETIK